MGNEEDHPSPLAHAERIFCAQSFDKPIEGSDEHANASLVFAPVPPSCQKPSASASIGTGARCLLLIRVEEAACYLVGKCAPVPPITADRG